MARKASADSDSARGFNDIIGLVVLVVALLLLIAQLSFDRYDLASVRTPPNRPAHNWIGPLGAHMASASFWLFGIAGYMLPLAVAFVGLGCFFPSLSYLRRRWPWAVVLLFSCMGLLYLLDMPHLGDTTSLYSRARTSMGAPSIGGFLGMVMYDFAFSVLGPIGAGIVYIALDLISLLFLTNFQLGDWVRGLWAGFGGACQTETSCPSSTRCALCAKLRSV